MATLAYQGYVLLWLSFGVSGENPPPEAVATANEASRGLVLTVLAPWALACVVLRRVRVLMTGLVCSAPAIWFWWEVSRTH